MLKKILTFLYQGGRDYTFWRYLVRNANYQTWLTHLFTTPRAQTQAVIDLDPSTLNLWVGGQDAGCGLLVLFNASDLDEIWRRTASSRPASQTGTPFADWFNRHPTQASTDLINCAIQTATMLFGFGGTLTTPAGQPAGAAVAHWQDIFGNNIDENGEVAMICFLYNIVIDDLNPQTYVEPSFVGGDFWASAQSPHYTTSADAGLALIMSASRNRAAQVINAITSLVQQCTRESWTSSSFGLHVQRTTQQGTTGMIPWLIIAKAQIIGSPVLRALYDVDESVRRALLPYEHIEDFMESAVVGNRGRAIGTMPASHTLRLATQSLPTPLASGCLPPYLLFKFKFVDAQHVEATLITQDDSVDPDADESLLLFDVRGALGGEHTLTPRSHIPECFVLAVISLLSSAPLFQNRIAVSKAGLRALEATFPVLVGRWARRDVEYNYNVLADWYMKDKVPLQGEMGNTGWLFTNRGLSMSPRARCGRASNSYLALPSSITVDGVTLNRDTTNTLAVTYRR
jgi:hypothetical protein